jgi:hypothetical protein
MNNDPTTQNQERFTLRMKRSRPAHAVPSIECHRFAAVAAPKLPGAMCPRVVGEVPFETELGCLDHVG